MKYIMGIDQGTTGTRAMIFDADVNIVAQAYSEFTQYFPKDGWVEHDAEEIWETTQAMMKKALAEAGITASAIAAIGITNQRETTIFWDKDTGKPVC
ncbi:MAG: FGGY family carbohydrate kinase, partial [Eubacterium sp.]